VRKRYLCPKHVEKTPSAVAYATTYTCFGCGAYGPLSELGLEPGERPEVQYVEDIEESIHAIKRLPKRLIRGINLHSNDRGYYILWDSPPYYKFSSFGDDSPGGKYRGPSGHSKPWLYVQTQASNRIALVEGEMNALSLAQIEPRCAIVCPGGAGDFYARNAKDGLTFASGFEIVDIIVDDDKAGAQAAIEATSRLRILGVNDVRIHLMKVDLNDTLTGSGIEALREEVRKLGLPVGV
jgi:hypothetical protein